MKKILKSILIICFLFCTILGLVACGDGGGKQLKEAEWKYATSQYRLKNSSYTLTSECYSSDKSTKQFTLVEEGKLNEQNVSVVKTRKNYANGQTPDNTFNEYYSFEYGTWTYGSLINGTENLYLNSTVETSSVEPFALIMKIFGDTPGQYIGSKFSTVKRNGSKYVYKDTEKELTFTFTEGYKNFDTWYVDVNKVNFKWNRVINGVEYYEEGDIRFFDLNKTTVIVPDEVRMNLFCQDYVVKDNIKEIYENHDSDKYVYSTYMTEDDYSIVSIRDKISEDYPVIYFGGQMSTNVLALPYTVRKGMETIDGVERNVFYLDVDSDVISDIKCYCNGQESRISLYNFGVDDNDTKNWPISFYTGEGLWSLSTTISYKVNGVEYKASGTNQVSYVLKSNAATVNDTPICLFYNYEYDLRYTDYQTNRLYNPYVNIVRTDIQIFALTYSDYLLVVPHVETIYTTDNDRLEYGKIFYATKLYVLDISNLETNDNGYFVFEYENETRSSSYVRIGVSGGNVMVIAQNSINSSFKLDVNVVLDSSEGLVSYYVIQN